MGGVTCRCLGNHGATLLKHPFALIAHRPIRSCVRMLCYSWMCVSVVRVLHAFIHVYIYIYIYTQKRHLSLSTCQIYKTRTYTIHFFTVTRLFMYAKLSIIIGTPPRTRSITVLWKISRALRIYREHFIARIFVITSWMKFIFQSRLFNNT